MLHADVSVPLVRLTTSDRFTLPVAQHLDMSQLKSVLLRPGLSGLPNS